MSTGSGTLEGQGDQSNVMQMLSYITDQMTSLAARMDRFEQPRPPQQPDLPEPIQRGGGGRGAGVQLNAPRAQYGPYERMPEDEPPPAYRPGPRPYDPRAHDPRDDEPPVRPQYHHPDVKLNPPTFSGKLDPEAYMDWERRMELLFEYYRYEDPRRVALATAQFKDHALTWWDREVAERRRGRLRPLTSWEELTHLMRRRYVPPHFHRELQRRFRRLTQGTKTVSEYYDEFEHLRNRLEITDSTESLMAQFLDGLQEKIARKVETQPYHDLSELFHLANQVEQSNKRKATCHTQPKPDWMKPYDKNTGPNNDPHNKGKALEVSHNIKPSPGAPSAANQAGPNQRSRDITCFKCSGRGHMARDCPNQRVMIVTASGGYESADEDKVETEPPEGTDEIEYPDTGELLMMRRYYVPEDEAEEVGYPDSGELLVVRRMLSTTIGDEESAQQENIIYSKCTIQGKKRKNKLVPRGDEPFQILEKINDNQLELPGEFNIFPAINVANLELFDAGDDLVLETKTLEEGGNDEDIGHMDDPGGQTDDPDGPNEPEHPTMEVFQTAHGPRPESVQEMTQTNGLLSTDQDPWRLLSHQTAGSGVFTITFG